MTPESACAPATCAEAPAKTATLAASEGPEDCCEHARIRAEAGQLSEARDVLVLCLATYPRHYPAFLQLARLLLHVGHTEDAVACLGQAAALAPALIDVQLQVAAGFAQAGRHALAVATWRAVLELQPGLPAALNNLGLSLAALGRTTEAEQAYRRVLEVSPDLSDTHANLAGLLQNLGNLEQARSHYRVALEARPDWAELWNNLGVTARALGRATEAEQSLREAVKLNPRYVEAWYNLGNALGKPGREREACSCYDTAIALKPDHAEALYGLATATPDLAGALTLYQRSLRARPEFPEALVGYACAKLKACDWNGLDGLLQRVKTLVQEEPRAIVAPFSFLQMGGDAALQQRCARNWAHNRIEPTAARQGALVPPGAAAGSRPRLVIGYLSGDFRNHAVGNLVADLFRLHDRSRFQVFGYSTGPDDASPTRARIAQGFDGFLEASDLAPRELAERIRADGVDILVDLAGYTEHSRGEVLALRAAPVQASYLGFPGTMGAGFVDALISDPFLTPESSAPWYDEQLVLLPLCYQINSEPRPALAGPAPSRANLGLPEQGFVFCCFNNSYKIQPTLFEVWMRILARTPGSVLWLVEFNNMARDNLRREAAARGVDPQRLVFSAVVPVDGHTKRLPAADLFLDTFPYSAGATASQTLRAGVPLLTMIGDAYVSRMAGSLLSALGLPELVVSHLTDYEQAAVDLAHNPAGLAQLRERLREAHIRTRLFDPARGTRALEAAYLALWDRARTGENADRRPLRVSDA